jgi:hypothetical protein
METFDPCAISTGADREIGIGLEYFPGIPVKSQYKVPIVDGQFNPSIGKRYGRTINGDLSQHSTAQAGVFRFAGSYTVTLTPVGALPLLLTSLCAVSSVANVGPPASNTHNWKNQKTCRTVTLVERLGSDPVNGEVWAVFPGTMVTGFGHEPALDSENVCEGSFTLQAVDCIIVNDALVNHITAGAITTARVFLGMDTATRDTLPAYVPDDWAITLNGSPWPVRNLRFDYQQQAGEIRVFNGHHGPQAHTKRRGVPSFTCEVLFTSMEQLWRAFGLTAAPLDPFGPMNNVTLDQVLLRNGPPNNPTGYSNVLDILFPTAALSAQVENQGDDETIVNVSVMPINAPGNAVGSDMQISLTNATSNATLLTAGALIDPRYWPVTKSKPYPYGFAAAGASTTVITVGNAANNPHITGADAAFVGRRLRFISGALAGQERTISAYVGATKQFTVGVAFGAAPATGDAFVIII